MAWWDRPASWWQFWYPQSGLFGGMLIAAIGFAVFYSFGELTFSLLLP
jgi:hypothetical protein